jgi:transcriptional regulator with XRE-family HTH domain
VPKRKTNPTKVRTKIARVRVDSDVTRAELAAATGLGLRNLQELETGWVENPGIRTLTRIAYALDVPIEKICEDMWISLTYRKKQQGKEIEKRVQKLVKRESG